MSNEKDLAESALQLYLSRFKGRENYFSQQYDTGYRPVNREMDTYFLRQHLAGDATYGVYVLTGESHCHFFCIDIDIPKAELTKTSFADRFIKFGLLESQLRDALQTLIEALGIPREAILLEETGGRGYTFGCF